MAVMVVTTVFFSSPSRPPSPRPRTTPRVTTMARTRLRAPHHTVDGDSDHAAVGGDVRTDDEDGNPVTTVTVATVTTTTTMTAAVGPSVAAPSCTTPAPGLG